MTATLVMTVLNEAASIGALLESVCTQTRKPDKVILVDGGSDDETIAVARGFEGRLPLRIIVEPGAGISRGRNLGIEAATSEFVAVTDGGVRLHCRWLDRLLEPLETGRADVASGFFRPDPHTLFERALGAVTLPRRDEIEGSAFLPSSRSVAFRRQVWQRVGGYPEWLDYCEDVVFDLRLRGQGCRFEFVPEAVVDFRPRSTLRAFFLQYYRYARGDGKAGLWPRRHLARYAAYGALIAAMLGMRPAVPLLLLGAVFYLRRPARRVILQRLPAAQQAQCLGLLPLLRATGDIAKMLGYPAGLWWRWRRTTGK